MQVWQMVSAAVQAVYITVIVAKNIDNNTTSYHLVDNILTKLANCMPHHSVVVAYRFAIVPWP